MTLIHQGFYAEFVLILRSSMPRHTHTTANTAPPPYKALIVCGDPVAYVAPAY
jgi:hypothetical protein